jgi:hypothetical protein
MATWLRTHAPITRREVERFVSVGLAGFLLLSLPASAEVGPDALAYCVDFGFSTEEDFVTRGPEPPDGDPIISDGDLLSFDHRVCARNADLLAAFDVSPYVDLGLDAVDVVTDGQDIVAAFSTELDSPNVGQFTAGDLLATNGTVIPNVVLIALFSISHDIGLDGLHFIGEPQDILAFLGEASQHTRSDWLSEPQMLITLLNRYDVDIWFSTEGTAPFPGFLDGDVLSAYQGIVVASNEQLLPPSVPAGIPLRGVDFGLDALGGDRQGALAGLQFSTEIGFPGQPAFGDQDLLGYQASFVRTGASLVAGFEPMSDDLGVDAVVPEPNQMLVLMAGCASLYLMARRRG